MATTTLGEYITRPLEYSISNEMLNILGIDPKKHKAKVLNNRLKTCRELLSKIEKEQYEAVLEEYKIFARFEGLAGLLEIAEFFKDHEELKGEIFAKKPQEVCV